MYECITTLTSFNDRGVVHFWYFVLWFRFFYRVMNSVKSPPCIGSWIPSTQICRRWLVSSLTSFGMLCGQRLMKRLHWKIAIFTVTIRIWAQIRTASQVACGHSIISSTTRKWSGLSSLHARHSSKWLFFVNIFISRSRLELCLFLLKLIIWDKVLHFYLICVEC